jgi:hypothetical protein
MRKNTKYILAGSIALLGIGYWFYQYNKAQNEARLAEIKRKYQNQSPPHNSDDWKSWIQLIIAIYGEANELWEEGGIFYGTNVPRPGSDKLDEILGKIKRGL